MFKYLLSLGPGQPGNSTAEPELQGMTYLVLLQELLHGFVRSCVFVLHNELTPPMANLNKREKTQ